MVGVTNNNYMVKKKKNFMKLSTLHKYNIRELVYQMNAMDDDDDECTTIYNNSNQNLC